jgi:hypothetical protein
VLHWPELEERRRGDTPFNKIAVWIHEPRLSAGAAEYILWPTEVVRGGDGVMCPALLLVLGFLTSASFNLKYSFLLWQSREARE